MFKEAIYQNLLNEIKLENEIDNKLNISTENISDFFKKVFYDENSKLYCMFNHEEYGETLVNKKKRPTNRQVLDFFWFVLKDIILLKAKNLHEMNPQTRFHITHYIKNTKVWMQEVPNTFFWFETIKDRKISIKIVDREGNVNSKTSQFSINYVYEKSSFDNPDFYLNIIDPSTKYNTTHMDRISKAIRYYENNLAKDETKTKAIYSLMHDLGWNTKIFVENGIADSFVQLIKENLSINIDNDLNLFTLITSIFLIQTYQKSSVRLIHYIRKDDILNSGDNTKEILYDIISNTKLYTDFHNVYNLYSFFTKNNIIFKKMSSFLGKKGLGINLINEVLNEGSGIKQVGNNIHRKTFPPRIYSRLKLNDKKLTVMYISSNQRFIILATSNRSIIKELAWNTSWCTKDDNNIDDYPVVFYIYDIKSKERYQGPGYSTPCEESLDDVGIDLHNKYDDWDSTKDSKIINEFKAIADKDGFEWKEDLVINFPHSLIEYETNPISFNFADTSTKLKLIDPEKIENIKKQSYKSYMAIEDTISNKIISGSDLTEQFTIKDYIYHTNRPRREQENLAGTLFTFPNFQSVKVPGSYIVKKKIDISDEELSIHYNDINKFKTVKQSKSDYEVFFNDINNFAKKRDYYSNLAASKALVWFVMTNQAKYAKEDVIFKKFPLEPSKIRSILNKCEHNTFQEIQNIYDDIEKVENGYWDNAAKERSIKRFEEKIVRHEEFLNQVKGINNYDRGIVNSIESFMMFFPCVSNHLFFRYTHKILNNIDIKVPDEVLGFNQRVYRDFFEINSGSHSIDSIENADTLHIKDINLTKKMKGIKDYFFKRYLDIVSTHDHKHQFHPSTINNTKPFNFDMFFTGKNKNISKFILKNHMSSGDKFITAIDNQLKSSAYSSNQDQILKKIIYSLMYNNKSFKRSSFKKSLNQAINFSCALYKHCNVANDDVNIAYYVIKSFIKIYGKPIKFSKLYNFIDQLNIKNPKSLFSREIEGYWSLAALKMNQHNFFGDKRNPHAYNQKLPKKLFSWCLNNKKYKITYNKKPQTYKSSGDIETTGLTTIQIETNDLAIDICNFYSEHFKSNPYLFEAIKLRYLKEYIRINLINS